jgi:hypothetical protein
VGEVSVNEREHERVGNERDSISGKQYELDVGALMPDALTTAPKKGEPMLR